MSRGIDALFQEEASSLVQSQVFRLIDIEVTTIATATASAGATTIPLSTLADADDGQYITIDGVDGVRQVLSKNVDDTSIEIDFPIDADVAEAEVRLHLLVADSNYAVTYDGLVYVQFPIQFSDISVNSDGTIDTAGLSVANVTREIMYYVEMYDGLRNREVTVKTVFAKFLDNTYNTTLQGQVTVAPNVHADPTAHVLDSYRVDSYTATETVVDFQLIPSINLSVKLPHRRYTSDSCYWRYGEAGTCEVDITALIEKLAFEGHPNLDELLVCNKSYAACVERENIERFGGFPGISGARRVTL